MRGLTIVDKKAILVSFPATFSASFLKNSL